MVAREIVSAIISLYMYSSNVFERANGGSCLAGPNGKWIVEPMDAKDDLLVAEINLSSVLEERHNFDPAGHYSRPDVTKLTVNRERQCTVHYRD